MVGGQQSARHVLHFASCSASPTRPACCPIRALACRAHEAAAGGAWSSRKLSDGFGAEADRIPARLPRSLGRVLRLAGAGVPRARSSRRRQFLEFARQFGRPEPHVIDQFHHPEHADILILSNVQKDGKPTGLADAGTYFHTDYSYLDVPARATTLYSIQVPKNGGDTLFANQYAAYDDLSSSMKNTIENLVALHHYGNRDDLDKGSRTVASVLTEEQEQKMAWVRHRVARQAPGHRPHRAVCGVGQLVRHRGHARGRGASTCSTSSSAMRRRRSTSCRLKYGVGDVVIWDNASLLHSATLTDPNDPRTLWRITIKEERKLMKRDCFLPRSAAAFRSTQARRADAARRVAVQRRPRLHQGAGALRGAGRRSTPARRSTWCCTRTASSASRSSTSSTWRRARRSTTPSCRRRTCRPSRRRRRSSTRRSCSATSRTGTRCSTPTCSSRSPTRSTRRPR